MSKQFNDQIPDLKIECNVDENGLRLILLEQCDSSGNIDCVAIHPIHLRYMAEKLGLVASSDAQTYGVIDSLQLRLATLKDRIDHLTDYLRKCSDREHANLDYELIYSQASSDIAEHFCADIEWLNDAKTDS